MGTDSYPMQGGICNALTRSGEPCRNLPMDGKKRCRMHGGKSRSGREHGRYRTGLHTKEAIADRRYLLELLQEVKEMIGMI